MIGKEREEEVSADRPLESDYLSSKLSLDQIDDETRRLWVVDRTIVVVWCGGGVVVGCNTRASREIRARSWQNAERAENGRLLGGRDRNTGGYFGIDIVASAESKMCWQMQATVRMPCLMYYVVALLFRVYTSRCSSFHLLTPTTLLSFHDAQQANKDSQELAGAAWTFSCPLINPWFTSSPR